VRVYLYAGNLPFTSILAEGHAYCVASLPPCGTGHLSGADDKWSI
jgi:hypothetical protein